MFIVAGWEGARGNTEGLPWRDIAITKTKTKTKIQGKAKEAIPRDCIKRPAQSSRPLPSYGI